MTGNSNNIFLVGPMGAGKSTIGRKLAKQLKQTFHDSDSVIEERTGVTISTIFDIEGEEGFRKRENQVIEELTALSNIVLATGGGAVLNPDNRKLLSDRGTVIYLKADLKQLIKRTGRDQKRPLLQNGDPAEQLEKILGEREPYYEEVADLIISSNRRTVKSIVQEICEQLTARSEDK